MKPNAFVWRCPVCGYLDHVSRYDDVIWMHDPCGAQMKRIPVYFEDKVRPLVSALRLWLEANERGDELDEATYEGFHELLATFNQEPTP